MADRTISDLIDPKKLTGMLSGEWMSGADLRVVDVRWRIGKPGAGRALYEEGHVPGAVFADMDGDLASAPGERGRHPLPSAEAFERLMDRLAIQDHTTVVAYDDAGGAHAARLWFLLRYFGHETCAVLDGGIDAWRAEGGALEPGPMLPAPTSGFRANPHPELLMEKDEVGACISGKAGSYVLLDARAPERFRGDTEPLDPKAGHIPGAVNVPFSGNLESGKFLHVSRLASRLRAFGVGGGTVGVYCGSGVTACHDLLALAVVGIRDARLYPGSWSEWSRDPSAPVATGA